MLSHRIAAGGFSLLCLMPVAAAPASAEALRIGGTGAGIALMVQASEALAAAGAGQPAKILPSLGTSGGLRALAECAIDIALAVRLPGAPARPGSNEVACVRTPLILATPMQAPPALTRAEAVRLYADPTARWPNMRPVRLILRPPTDSASALLADLHPDMPAALQAARQRPEIPIALTDQDNADLAEATHDSLIVMGLAQLVAERRNLSPIPLDGVAPSAAIVETGGYRPVMDICLLVKNPPPVATAFVAFLKSVPGRKTLRDNAAVLLDAP